MGSLLGLLFFLVAFLQCSALQLFDRQHVIFISGHAIAIWIGSVIDQACQHNNTAARWRPLGANRLHYAPSSFRIFHRSPHRSSSQAGRLPRDIALDQYQALELRPTLSCFSRARSMSNAK